MTSPTPAEVKRYDSMGMHDELGLYVRWADYDATLRQHAELVERVRLLTNALAIARPFVPVRCDATLAAIEAALKDPAHD